MTTCEDRLNSLASPLATKNPQKAPAALGASGSAEGIAGQRNSQRFMVSSFWRRVTGDLGVPQEARAGQEPVQEGHDGRERGQGPKQAVGPEIPEGDGVRERRHGGAEENAA